MTGNLAPMHESDFHHGAEHRRSQWLPSLGALNVPCHWSLDDKPAAPGRRSHGDGRIRFALMVGFAGWLATVAPFAVHAEVPAATVAGTTSPLPPMVADFRALAHMRPRACEAEQALPIVPPGWREREAQCGWRGRLEVRGWVAASAGAANCISAAATWWHWALEAHGAPRSSSSVWQRAWHSQSVAFETQGTQVLLLVAQAADGAWLAREWRWKPSDRAATRVWQAARWQELLTAVRPLQRAMPPWSGEGSLVRVKTAWLASIGTAPKEIVAGQWRWVAQGRCLAVESLGEVESNFQLPYLVEDSRLEQRAAMQLQLARRTPNAVWLQPFDLVEAARQNQQGIARFKALWREGDVIRGQLWLPSGRDGPVLRLRISTAASVPAGAQGSGTATEIVAQEMERLVKWMGRIDG